MGASHHVENVKARGFIPLRPLFRVMLSRGMTRLGGATPVADLLRSASLTVENAAGGGFVTASKVAELEELVPLAFPWPCCRLCRTTIDRPDNIARDATAFDVRCAPCARKGA